MPKYTPSLYPQPIPNLSLLDEISAAARRDEDLSQTQLDGLRVIAQHFIDRHCKSPAPDQIEQVLRAGLKSLNDSPSRTSMSDAMWRACGGHK
jgi:hypothetical protein